VAGGVVMTERTTARLTEGVHAFLQLPGHWGVNNVGIVHDGDSVLLVDTTQTPARTERLRSAVAELTTAPVRMIVNTHHHGDHTFGNYLFRGATVVGHRQCREEMIARGLHSVVFPDQAERLGDVRIEPPAIVFDDRVDAFVGDIRCVMRHLGGSAHTSNDVIVHLPDHGVVFAGDLAFNDSTPFALAGSVLGSIRVSDELAGIDAAIVVPGHGPVATPAIFGRVADYYRLVQASAADAIERDLDALEAARRTDLGDFSRWLAPERLVANVALAMSELSPAHPLDVGRAIDDMIAFNGGHPLEHPHD
jgi:cyclase